MIKEWLKLKWEGLKFWGKRQKEEIQKDGLKSYLKKRIKQILIGVGVITYALAQVLPSQNLEEEIIQRIEFSQNAYFQEHGRYWQGLKTHTSIPDKETTPDNLSVKPHYQEKGWSDLVDLPDTLPFQITVNSYKAPKENYGYWVILENENFKRSVGYGIEAEYHTYEIIKEISTSTATTTQ